jgi:hypothetical protein
MAYRSWTAHIAQEKDPSRGLCGARIENLNIARNDNVQIYQCQGCADVVAGRVDVNTED